MRQYYRVEIQVGRFRRRLQAGQVLLDSKERGNVGWLRRLAKVLRDAADRLEEEADLEEQIHK